MYQYSKSTIYAAHQSPIVNVNLLLLLVVVVRSLVDVYGSLEYKSISGNLTILLSDRLFQFVILEGFFKEIPINESNRYKRNFKNFNEREFQETLSGVNWDTILSLDNNDPNLSINNFYNHLNLYTLR